MSFNGERLLKHYGRMMVVNAPLRLVR